MMSEPKGPLHARGRIAQWVHGARLYSLTITVAPILVGVGLVLGTRGAVATGPVVAATVSALSIQIATNLANDAADGASGLDAPDRIGPARLTGSGALSPGTVRAGALVMTALAAVSGLVAVWSGGWPILAIGIASILAGWAYSFGPRPISGSPFGEVCVVVFFGVLAVSGTAWLAGGVFGVLPVLLGVAIGLPAAAVLTVNNHRDRVQDQRGGRRTLAICLGPRRTTWLYGAQMTGASLIAAMSVAPMTPVGAAILALGAVLGGWMGIRLARTPPGPLLSRRLAETARYQLVLAVVLAFILVWRP